MKKIFTSIALLSMLAVGCTKTDDLAGTKPGDSFTTAEEASGYMAINIVTPGGANTRADGEYPAGSGTYEDGTGYENKVDTIRFYFFKDGEGGKVPAQVKKNPESKNDDDEYYSYIDYKVLPYDYNEDDEDDDKQKDHSQTVEKIVRLTVALNFPEGEEPKYVVAVVNPTAAVRAGFGKNPAMPTLAELEEQVANFQPTKTGGNYNKFIMSSSVYKKDNAKVNFAKIGTLFNTMEDAEEALTNPDKRDLLTVIYVERIAARLDLYVKTGAKLKPADDGYEPTDKTNVFMTDKKYRKYDEINEIDIYVKFLAWQVISTPKRSNLLKDISVDAKVWPDDMFGATEPWNSDNYHRSFWAINPSVLVGAGHPYDNFVSTEVGIDYQFYSYKQIVDDGIKSFPASADEAEKVYMQENAAYGDNNEDLNAASTRKNHETKVIVAAELKRPDGTALEIAEYGYKYYEKNELLKYFAEMLPFYTKPYSKDNNQQDEDTHMKAADLEYKTHREYTGDAGVDIEGSYYSFVKLAGNKTWYKKGEDESVSEAIVQKYIDDEINSSSLLIWEGGRTYYYFTIRHLAGEPTLPEGQDKATYEDYQKTPGYYGVVRNHIYRAGINKLVGIGTPVFKENEPIYPEQPNHDGHIMAAEIRVLSWRVVDQEYDFSW